MYTCNWILNWVENFVSKGWIAHLMMSNFSFCHPVFKSHLLQRNYISSVCWKGLNKNCDSLSFKLFVEPKYWTPRSERIYSIDKSCDVRENCEQEQKLLGLSCMRDWYRDWRCTECCQGDRCNYYVTVSKITISSELP